MTESSEQIPQTENTQEQLDAAHKYLRARSRGELRFDEHLRPIKYIVVPDGEYAGRLAAPVMVAMLQSMDTVLFIPEATDGAMEVQVTLMQFDDEKNPFGAIADRWRIYHGEPEDVRWAIMEIDAARHGNYVVDGDALMRENPLADIEAKVCKQINTDHRAELPLLCKLFANIEVENATLVGVDPLGFDLRGKFDVLRVEADHALLSEKDALDTFAELLSQAAGNDPT